MRLFIKQIHQIEFYTLFNWFYKLCTVHLVSRETIWFKWIKTILYYTTIHSGIINKMPVNFKLEVFGQNILLDKRYKTLHGRN